MARHGVTVVRPDQPETQPQAADETPFEIWPENEATFTAFMLLQHDWRLAPGGQVMGLDKAGLSGLLDDLQVSPSDERLAVRVGLAIMETIVVAEKAQEAATMQQRQAAAQGQGARRSSRGRR